jgi:hypothetical protein
MNWKPFFLQVKRILNGKLKYGVCVCVCVCVFLNKGRSSVTQLRQEKWCIIRIGEGKGYLTTQALGE